MNAGFVITAKGWDVLGRVVADHKKLNIKGVAFGNGDLQPGENPALLTTLKSAEFLDDGGIFVDGTTTTPIVETDEAGSKISFICECRSDFGRDFLETESEPEVLNEGEEPEEEAAVGGPISGMWPCQITERWEIHEFGVWAENPDDVDGDPVMIYYATLGDTPHPVTPYSLGAIDIREYPVSISISEAAEVEISYPPLPFVTDDWVHKTLEYHHEHYCMPDVLQAIAEHNVDPESHPDLRKHINSNDDRITILENLFNQEAAVSFMKRLEDLTEDSVILYGGAHDAVLGRISF